MKLFTRAAEDSFPLKKKPDTGNTSQKFKPVWEIDSHFRCPLVGAVFSVEQHRRILRKCGYDTRGMKPYEYHEYLMARLSEKNTLSIKVDNVFKNQARKYMNAIKGKSQEDIRTLWEQASDSGNVGPVMYAIVSYEGSSPELLHDVYGEVHMQAHANMTRVHDLKKQLGKAEAIIQREKQARQEQKNDIRELAGAHKKALEQIRALEEKNQKIETRHKTATLNAQGSIESGGGMAHLHRQIEDMTVQLRRKDEKLRLSERDKRALQIELFGLKNENKMIEEQLHALIAGIEAVSPSDSIAGGPIDCPAENCSDTACFKEACGHYRTCPKRVFMIGGITKMKPFYKNIIEKTGARFDYHDGYLKNSAVNLEARVKRSDLILCPANCNSHNACLRVKKLCNRHNKQLKILSNSSLSAIAQAVFEPESQKRLPDNLHSSRLA